MSRTVGIDFGTTNSVIAVLTGSEPEVLTNSEGSRTTPSVVAFAKDGELLVGEVARRQRVTNPKRTVSSVKRHMGDPSWHLDVDGKTLTAEQVASHVIAKLKKDAETYLADDVKDAVITVPAYFNDAQRQATKDAGTLAGLNVLRIVNEPTAAALTYGLDKGNDDQTVLVFDLGGGTFDVSLLELGGGVLEVRATSGDNQLGGDDWDRRLAEFLAHEFYEEHGVDLMADPAAEQRLRDAAETAKKELSSSARTNISLPYIAATADGTPLMLERDLPRSKFEEVTSDLLARCRVPFAVAVADSGMDVTDVDHVVMVGGSTRMPAVTELVRELTGGKEPNRSVNPDEVVAAGATLQAGVLAGEVKAVLLLDVTPLTLGIETGTGMMAPLITRNTTIPARESEVFSTASDGQQSVSIKVYQGERPRAQDNKQLGVFELTGLPPAPKGVPKIEVTFDIDADGLVNVSASDRATGLTQTMAITGGSGLSDAEIERMMADAREHEEEDTRRRDEASAKDEAGRAVNAAESLLGQYGDRVPATERAATTEAMANVREALGGGAVNKIKDATLHLVEVSQRAGAALYGQAAPSGNDGPSTGPVDDPVVPEPAPAKDGSSYGEGYDAGQYPSAGEQDVPPPPAWASR